MSPKPTGVEENLKSNSIFVTRERSLSPLSMSQIPEQQKEGTRATTSYRFSSPPSSVPKRQTAIVNELVVVSPPGGPYSQETQEYDDNALHGSSEFMLVLYPEDEERGKYGIGMLSDAEFSGRVSISKFKFLTN